MPEKYFLVGCLVLLVVTSFFCAGQIIPSGGPPDKSPPEIILMYPDSAAVNFHDTRLSISFNKYVDRRSLEESIFFSPSLGTLSFDWGSKEVEIQFSDSLRPNTTYIMTIGTDFADTRGNHLAKAFSLPFATGEHIDSGSISGAVIDPKGERVMIFAYTLLNPNLDTLDARHTKPDYLTQTGKDGSFVLPYLALNSYRLIAVRDELKNLLYDPQDDQYGVFHSDVALTTRSPTRSGMQCRLTSEDTTSPFLSRARAIDRTHVLLRFSEAVDPTSVDLSRVTVIDTMSQSVLGVKDISFIEESFLEAQLVTAPMESAAVYVVTLNNFTDRHHNMMKSPTNRAEFLGITVPDTSRPSILSATPLNNALHVEPQESIKVVLSESVRKSSFEHGFSLQDSNGTALQGTFLWNQSSIVQFLLQSGLSYNMSYTLSILMDSVVDLSGNRAKDSITTHQFTTMDEDVLSSLSGTILDDLVGATGRVHIDAENISHKEVSRREVITNAPAYFEFEKLPEGEYVLTAFRDADSNGVYTYGKPFPFLRSERFAIYPETLKVRARWPLEGITIRFK